MNGYELSAANHDTIKENKNEVNRLRYCIWHDWKKPDRKRKNLIRLGIEQGMAYAWSRTRMGGWRTAQSPILGTTITIARLKSRGYLSFVDYYKLVKHH